MCLSDLCNDKIPAIQQICFLETLSESISSLNYYHKSENTFSP